MTQMTPTGIRAGMPLLVLLISIRAANALADQEIDPEYQRHCDPPHPYGDRVDEAGAAFYYLSDVENCSGDGRLPLLVSQVRNIHSDDLIITWEADGIFLISRPASNKLPAGETEDGSHPICGYDEHPDTNTTISYTQQPITKRVAAYLEEVSCQRDDDALLDSHIRTAYKDNDGTVHNIQVDFRSFIVGEALLYEIDKSSSNVDLALGGLSDAIGALLDEQQIKYMQESIASDVGQFGADTIFTTLYDWKSKHLATDLIPPTLGSHKVIIFKYSSQQGKTLYGVEDSDKTVL